MTATAGAGWKDFVAGATLPSSEVDSYLMAQSVMRFATTGARDSAMTGATAPVEGMQCYIDALDIRYSYNGSAWVFKEGWGTGSPEGVVTATKGGIWHRTDGSTGTTLYIKESDTTNTGWVAINVASTVLGSAVVATQESTTSATYTALSTPGPTVSSVTTPASGAIIVTVTTNALNTSINNVAYMGFAISGTDTVAASDTKCLAWQAYTNSGELRCSATYRITGLTPAGTITVASQYKASGATASFKDRNILVEAG